jgi:hypothetical protein
MTTPMTPVDRLFAIHARQSDDATRVPQRGTTTAHDNARPVLQKQRAIAPHGAEPRNQNESVSQICACRPSRCKRGDTPRLAATPVMPLEHRRGPHRRDQPSLLRAADRSSKCAPSQPV